ncbi:MAG: hypothetical protein JWM43_3120 [Acidobacteriaceae bacterium]|nr:hypothetical protein [Acidobacteriaceae bacterium]
MRAVKVSFLSIARLTIMLSECFSNTPQFWQYCWLYSKAPGALGSKGCDATMFPTKTNEGAFC